MKLTAHSGNSETDIMYKALCILPLLLLSACSTTSQQPQAEFKPQQAPVNLLAQQLVDELVIHNDALKPTQPLLVMTPAIVEDMQGSNALASQLQQSLMTAFHQRGFNLVDLNLAEAVRVTPQGDFILTRDWQQLPTDIAVDHVLVTSMSQAKGEILFNSRIVNVNNNRVLSTAGARVLEAQLPGYLAPSHKVVSKEGLLYRYENRGEDKSRIVGDK
ncbi:MULTISPECIES: FlgO family outer membrane protein [Shewanella]|uniref:FlgO family outer membrane protein n=1 Tax=Shewanella TaxID=22 RepID=UPI00068A13C3|nr:MULTISPECIES: FlgO family outer membrane protein [Shewanella]MCL1160730.1 hypothetical protein [Shewanella chilikensis]